MYVNLYNSVGGNFVCKLQIANLTQIQYGQELNRAVGVPISNFYSPANAFLFDFNIDGYYRSSKAGWIAETTPPNSMYLLQQYMGSSSFTLYAENGNRIIFYPSAVYFRYGNTQFELIQSDGEFAYRLIAYDGNNFGALFFKYTVGNTADSYNKAWINRVSARLNATESERLSNWFNGIVIQDSTDPYDPGGESEPEGGEGDFDDTTDPVDFPDLPTLSAVDTGFITLFNPSIAELKSLATYMWSQAFDLATLKKLFADPMDCILGLSIVPVAVPNAGQRAVTVGNIPTGVSMNAAASQYVEVDCGTLNVNEYWGSYLDYDPYTKCEIYLPYIGTHALAVDDVMKKAVHVKYHIDLLSGAMAAYVKCGDSVLYEFIGQCASSIPITGNDWTNVINGVLGIAGSIGTMVATGGASAPLAVPGIASTAVNALKPNVEKSGSLSGTGGMLGIQKPYLILTRPRQSLPAYQNQYKGYPSNITKQLSDCSGYTEVESIHMDNIPCTENELQEIEDLLKSGVIF